MKIEIPEPREAASGLYVRIEREKWYALVRKCISINKMLDAGEEVNGYDASSGHGEASWRWDGGGKVLGLDYRRKALLINQQPIKKDTAEDLLKELSVIDDADQLRYQSTTYLDGLLKRARKLNGGD